MKEKTCKCGPSCTCKVCACGPYASFFDTLGNESRISILNALRSGPKNVGQIVEATGLEQTCASHCLRKLERNGFVTVRREGKYRIYALERKTIEPLMALIHAHIRTYRAALLQGRTCACGRGA